MRRLVLLVSLTACKASLGEGMQDGAVPGDTADDAADAMQLGPWGAPTAIPITPVADDDPSATGDLLELYFNREEDIYVVTRASTADPWGTPEVVDELSSAEAETEEPSPA